jgi:hypothetical protein
VSDQMKNDDPLLSRSILRTHPCNIRTASISPFALDERGCRWAVR